MRINLHNHSKFSDGKLTPSEIVEAAINAGLSHVAITDHFASGKLNTHGVDQTNIAAYEAVIKNLAARCAHKIKVLVGVEVDFSPARMDFSLLRASAPQESIFRNMDFVLFEYVGDPEWKGGSLEQFIEIRPMIPCPVGLAHSDFERNFAGFMAQTVVTILEQNNVFLELCPAERNASMVPADPALDLGKIHHELHALHKQMETLSKQLAYLPNDPYLLSLRKKIDDQTDLIYSRFKKVPAYRLNGRFTRDLFARVRGRNVPISIGTDTHDSPSEVIMIGDAVKFIEEQMLQRNVITNFFWKS
jgi:histidinol phosphatase-like PHP family hydrolase